jgi:HAE1 family hydrophobic/amphiphilic exporter-1
MEELVTRPIEQAVSAVAGLEQINSTSSEGSSMVRLNFVWGTDLSEAADEVRTRVDRVRGRLPNDADPPTIFKFDSNAMPIMGIGVEGDYDIVTLREVAQNELSPRLERVGGVAAVTIDGGLRRQIRVDLSREKITALSLSVDRVVQILRTENQNIPRGEVDEADRTYLLRSPGQFQNLDEVRNTVVLTRQGVPIYLRDIADVYDGTEDMRSITRINGQPGIRMRVTKQSGTNTVAIARGVKAEIERINREVPGVRLTVLDDSSQPPLHLHHLDLDSDLDGGYVRAALLRRLHAEHAHLRRPGARDRDDRRCLDRGAREHLSAPRDGQGSDDGRHRGE